MVFYFCISLPGTYNRILVITPGNKTQKQNPCKLLLSVQQNIYSKELIKLENLAAHFNKSADHLSRY